MSMKDRFGITQLFPTVGAEWTSNWDNGKERELKNMSSNGRKKPFLDPYDNWVDLHCHSYKEEKNWASIDGNGVMKLLGPHPRLHIHKPLDQKNLAIWKNTEMTCYAYVPSQGAFMSGYYPPGSSTFQTATNSQFDLRTRSIHHLEHLGRCNGLSYISTINLMKSFHAFRKEIVHGYYANQPGTRFIMPKDKWWGQKFICRDYDNDTKVKLEKYLNLDGDKVTWTKVGEKLDTGSWAITDKADKDGAKKYIPTCKKKCIDKKPPGPPWNKIILRAGRGAYIRTDFSKDLRFKWFSIREIAPLP
jgi:hypothetical protein